MLLMQMVLDNFGICDQADGGMYLEVELLEHKIYVSSTFVILKDFF